VTAGQVYYATENWNSGISNVGSGWALSLQPTATTLSGTSRITVIDATPQAINTRSDGFNIKSKANTNLVTIDNDGRLQVFNTDPTNPNNLYGYATKVFFSTTENSLGNNITLKPGALAGSSTYDKQTELSVIQNTTDGAVFASYEMKTQRFDGTNYSPTANGNSLGRLLFNGNSATGATPSITQPGATVSASATETWSGSVAGTKLTFGITKTGTNTNLAVIDAASTSTTFKSDSYTFQDSNSTNIAGGLINYRRTHGCFHKIANVTAAAANTVYNFDWFTDTTAHVGNQGVTVTSGNPTRVNIDTAGRYTAFMEMQVKNTVSANRVAWIWLAKNGTDLSETRIKAEIKQGGGTDAYQLISKLWLLENIAANDYIEVRFAVDNITGISLEYEAAQTSPFAMPAQPSATFTIVPVGA
jgi:hypothetical protein